MEFDKISKRFYEDNFKISTDRLKAAWQYGEDFESFLMKTENLAWKLERIYLENYKYDNLVGIYSTLSDLFNTAAE
jgi:hypothetical protein